jgi:hypothetical protein
VDTNRAAVDTLVEAGSNTSTVTLRVVGGDEKGSLRSERVKYGHGHAIAEAVSRSLPTAAARVQSQVWSSGICGGQSVAGAGFLRVLRFPLPFIPPNSPCSQSPGAGTIGQ